VRQSLIELVNVQKSDCENGIQECGSFRKSSILVQDMTTDDMHKRWHLHEFELLFKPVHFVMCHLNRQKEWH